MSQKGNANLHFTVLSRAQESDYSDCSGEKHLEKDDSRLSFNRFPARFELTGGLAQHKKGPVKDQPLQITQSLLGIL